MGFTPVKNVRISSLEPGSLVELRMGKAAAKSVDDVTVAAKLLRHKDDGDKSVAVFVETGADGVESEISVSRFPGASWRNEGRYVSLLSVDEATYTPKAPAPLVQTDSIGRAIKLIQAEADDVYGAESLIALLTQIQDGKRINNSIKDLANQFAGKLVEELSSLPDANSN